MGSEFPRSPLVLKGGLVAYRLPDLFPTVIVFQYNPDEVSRSLQMHSTTGSAGRGERTGSTDRRRKRHFLGRDRRADQSEKPGENVTTVDTGCTRHRLDRAGLVDPSYRW